MHRLPKVLPTSIALLCCFLLLAACGSDDEGGDVENSTTPTPAATGTPLVSASATRIPTGESTPSGTLTLSIWWPDTLYPADADVLDRQISEFVSIGDTRIDVDFRRKRAQDVGGIMSTLRSSSQVAPDAMPDVTLIRRQDLLSAFQDDLIQPLDGLIPAVIIGDLYDVALELGQLDGQIYGLPYMVGIEYLASMSALGNAGDTMTGMTYQMLLDGEANLIFPGGRVNGVNDTFYVQYLSAGGTEPEDDGTIAVNRSALLDTLSFYEDARELGLVGEEILDFDSTSDYQLEFATGEFELAVVDSTTYLTLRAEGSDLHAAYIPTESGAPVSTISGWMWVVTTKDANRQALAGDFISWMMEPDRQREFASVVHMLPSQQSVLQALGGDIVDVLLMDNILENAVIPLTDSSGGIVARAMQSAFVSVVSGESTALEATEFVLDQVDD